MAFYMNISRHCGRLRLSNYLISCNNIQSSLPITSSASVFTVESFKKKNERLQRPMSPHLTIYKPQLTTILSLTHRATGLALSAGLYGLSISMLLLPANFPHYFEALQSLHIGSPIIFSLKFALAWSVFYHTFNGVRHLAWDMGYGFDIKTLYLSGYLVAGSSIAAAVIAAML